MFNTCGQFPKNRRPGSPRPRLPPRGSSGQTPNTSPPRRHGKQPNPNSRHTSSSGQTPNTSPPRRHGKQPNPNSRHTSGSGSGSGLKRLRGSSSSGASPPLPPRWNRAARHKSSNHSHAQSYGTLKAYLRAEEKYEEKFLHGDDPSHIMKEITMAEKRLMESKEIEVEFFRSRQQILKLNSVLVKTSRDAEGLYNLKLSRPFWDLGEVVVEVEDEEETDTVMFYLKKLNVPLVFNN